MTKIFFILSFTLLSIPAFSAETLNNDILLKDKKLQTLPQREIATVKEEPTVAPALKQKNRRVQFVLIDRTE